MSPMAFEIIDKLVRYNGSPPPEPGARLIVMDDDGGAQLCEVAAVSTTEGESLSNTDDEWSVEFRVLPWPDGWSVHKRGDGHEIHRPTATKKEDDQ